MLRHVGLAPELTYHQRNIPKGNIEVTPHDLVRGNSPSYRAWYQQCVGRNSEEWSGRDRGGRPRDLVMTGSVEEKDIKPFKGCRFPPLLI